MKLVYNEIIRFIRDLYSKPNGFVPLHTPLFVGNEKKYLNRCIDTSYVSSVGEYVELFELKIAEFTGARRAVACMNGTNSLFLALKLAGVSNNTEVITQPLSFIATANAIVYTGADPVFIDVDKDTLGLSPESLNLWLRENTFQSLNKDRNEPECINKRTGKKISAVVPMHTFGHPCRIDQIAEICQQFGIPLIEDAAESIGSSYRGKHTGTFGFSGVISFNGNKIITTGGGGVLLFMNNESGNYAKHLSTQAKIPHPWEFIHDEVGYNYRMPNINAALGLAQMEMLPEFIRQKRIVSKLYSDFFDSIGINFVREPENSQSNYWLNSIRLKNRSERDEFLKISNENGVMTRPAWRLLCDLSFLKGYQVGEIPNSRQVENTIVNIPSSVIIR